MSYGVAGKSELIALLSQFYTNAKCVRGGTAVTVVKGGENVSFHVLMNTSTE